MKIVIAATLTFDSNPKTLWRRKPESCRLPTNMTYQNQFLFRVWSNELDGGVGVGAVTSRPPRSSPAAVSQSSPFGTCRVKFTG